MDVYNMARAENTRAKSVTGSLLYASGAWVAMKLGQDRQLVDASGPRGIIRAIKASPGRGGGPLVQSKDRGGRRVRHRSNQLGKRTRQSFNHEEGRAMQLP